MLFYFEIEEKTNKKNPIVTYRSNVSILTGKKEGTFITVK